MHFATRLAFLPLAALLLAGCAQNITGSDSGTATDGSIPSDTGSPGSDAGGGTDATGDAAASDGAVPDTGSVTITPGGGTFTAGPATILVPPGAVASDVTVTVTATRLAVPPGYAASGPLYRFEPEGTVFAKPVRVTLPTPAGTSAPTMFWSRADGSGYMRLATRARVGSVHAWVTHFSTAFIGDGDQSAPADDAGTSCDTPLTDCGGSCAALDSDPANCSACGYPCAAMEACVNSVCVPGGDEPTATTDLVVRLTWDGSGDVDLHLHNPNNSPWFNNSASEDDCFYAALTPNWGGGTSVNLDRDNTVSDGPEQIHLTHPLAGQAYTVAAHHYARAEGRIATVQIYCGDHAVTPYAFTSHPLVGTESGNCSGNDFWTVARVTFAADGSCAVAPVDTYEAASLACSQL